MKSREKLVHFFFAHFPPLPPKFSIISERLFSDFECWNPCFRDFSMLRFWIHDTVDLQNGTWQLGFSRRFMQVIKFPHNAENSWETISHYLKQHVSKGRCTHLFHLFFATNTQSQVFKATHVAIPPLDLRFAQITGCLRDSSCSLIFQIILVL